MKEHSGISGCGMLGSSVCLQPQRDQEGPRSPGRHSQTHSCLMSVSLKGEAVTLLDFICALSQDTGKSRLEELIYGVPDGLPWAASPVLFPALDQYSCSLSLPICLGDLGQARPCWISGLTQKDNSMCTQLLSCSYQGRPACA